ncbi:uncharacterized protein LOC110676785 [Aedes aegypti]|uniref:Uncharacterized protein n=1 Tax=Aedes aegypti TaxID=7159 RepID=A0A6I8U0Y2_AEDAE|nr:uncharacterized protein LOC110676785 [Aedes aegypti]
MKLFNKNDKKYELILYFWNTSQLFRQSVSGNRTNPCCLGSLDIPFGESPKRSNQRWPPSIEGIEIPVPLYGTSITLDGAAYDTRWLSRNKGTVNRKDFNITLSGFTLARVRKRTHHLKSPANKPMKAGLNLSRVTTLKDHCLRHTAHLIDQQTTRTENVSNVDFCIDLHYGELPRDHCIRHLENC